MHLLEVGIEHLSTGMEIKPTAGHEIRIETSNASMFMVISDAPFSIHWTPMDCTVYSTEQKFTGAKTFSAQDVTFYAQDMARAMRKADKSRKPITNTIIWGE